jgi:pimeloyl-ACP methyl ester carboxylesterase
MDYGFSTHARDIDAFIRALNVDRVVLVGMSLGGLAAIRYAGDRGSPLAGLVIIDIGPETQEAGARRVQEFMDMPAELDSVEAYVARAKAFNPRRDENVLRRSLRHNLRRTPAGTWVWKYDARHRKLPGFAERAAQARLRLWESVRTIVCPTLVVRGGESDVFSDENAIELTGRLPNGRHAVVPGAGHTVQGDNPRGLLDVLRPFLSEVLRP